MLRFFQALHVQERRRGPPGRSAEDRSLGRQPAEVPRSVGGRRARNHAQRAGSDTGGTLDVRDDADSRRRAAAGRPRTDIGRRLGDTQTAGGPAPVPDGGAPRRRRNGRGLPRFRSRPEKTARDQDGEGGVRQAPDLALPERGAGPRSAGPSEHRPRLRDGTDRGQQAVLHDARGPRGDAPSDPFVPRARGSRLPSGVLVDPTRADLPSSDAGGGVRARQRSGAPGHQAREHHGWGARRGHPSRLGRREAPGRDRGLDRGQGRHHPDGLRGRNAHLHVSGTGHGRRRGCPHRRLRARNSALRDPDPRASIHRKADGGDDRTPRETAPVASGESASARNPARARADVPPRPRERARFPPADGEGAPRRGSGVARVRFRSRQEARASGRARGSG